MAITATAVQQGATRKPFFRTKAEWASAEADNCRYRARALVAARAHVPGSAPRTRDDEVSALHREAAKFDRMADAFRRRGV